MAFQRQNATSSGTAPWEAYAPPVTGCALAVSPEFLLCLEEEVRYIANEIYRSTGNPDETYNWHEAEWKLTCLLLQSAGPFQRLRTHLEEQLCGQGLGVEDRFERIRDQMAMLNCQLQDRDARISRLLDSLDASEERRRAQEAAEHAAFDKHQRELATARAHAAEIELQVKEHEARRAEVEVTLAKQSKELSVARAHASELERRLKGKAADTTSRKLELEAAAVDAPAGVPAPARELAERAQELASLESPRVRARAAELEARCKERALKLTTCSVDARQQDSPHSELAARAADFEARWKQEAQKAAAASEALRGLEAQLVAARAEAATLR